MLYLSVPFQKESSELIPPYFFLSSVNAKVLCSQKLRLNELGHCLVKLGISIRKYLGYNAVPVFVVKNRAKILRVKCYTVL